jgi:hypothetical protein
MAFARARGILPTLQSVFNVHGDNRPEDRDNEKAERLTRLFSSLQWFNDQDGHNRIRTCDFCRVKTALYR